jgi:predicted RNA-binding Zn-ribbon protein involved in translation (DUF1610 family)
MASPEELTIRDLAELEDEVGHEGLTQREEEYLILAKMMASGDGCPECGAPVSGLTARAEFLGLSSPGALKAATLMAPGTESDFRCPSCGTRLTREATFLGLQTTWHIADANDSDAHEPA